MTLIRLDVIKQLKEQQKRLENGLKVVQKQLTKATDPDLVEILNQTASFYRQRIRGTKRAIEWENSRNDYLSEYKADLARLSKFLGKEVYTHLKSDKGEPQILLGLYWKISNDPNYARSEWTAMVQCMRDGKPIISDISIKFVKTRK